MVFARIFCVKKPPLTPPSEGNKKVRHKRYVKNGNKSTDLAPSPLERAGVRTETLN
jgi:hypothetical protein